MPGAATVQCSTQLIEVKTGRLRRVLRAIARNRVNWTTQKKLKKLTVMEFPGPSIGLSSHEYQSYYRGADSSLKNVENSWMHA